MSRDDTCKIKKGATTGVCRNDGTTCESFADCTGEPALQVLAGRKTDGDAVAQVGGSIGILPGKNGSAVVSVRVQGLDLATVTGATDVTVAIGTASAGTQVQATGGKIK